jgi:DNA-binding transcriptional regulator YdaS (Cro superfamily)
MAISAPDLEPLRKYLNELSRPEQDGFAERCDTSVGYLRKAISTGERLRESLVIDLERESAGEVRCEKLRPDVDWAYLRGSQRTPSTNSRKRA